MTIVKAIPFPNGLLAFSKVGTALMLLQIVLSAVMRGLIGSTGWQGREHPEPVSLTYITSIPLADEVSLYYISVLQHCKSCRGIGFFHLMQHYHTPETWLPPPGLLFFCPSLKTFGFPLEGQCCWSRNCQWEMSWCVSWKGANKCHSQAERGEAFLVITSQNVRNLQGDVFKPHAGNLHSYVIKKKVESFTTKAEQICIHPTRRWRNALCTSASFLK